MSVAVIDECGCLMLMLIPVGIFKREREPISVQYVQESVHLVASHVERNSVFSFSWFYSILHIFFYVFSMYFHS